MTGHEKAQLVEQALRGVWHSCLGGLVERDTFVAICGAVVNRALQMQIQQSYERLMDIPYCPDCRAVVSKWATSGRGHQ